MDSEARHNYGMNEYMSKELARLMRQAGVSQSGLSRATGVPQPTINRILSQTTQNPRRESMVRLANYFGVPAETLYGKPETGNKSQKNNGAIEDVFNRILSLSKTERSTLFTLVADKFNDGK